MAKNVLITGGAGFVGSHLADALLAAGHNVRIFDSLTPQVHGGQIPAYLSAEVELAQGDMRDADAVQAALEGIDVVFHLAAAVGVGQSMYEIARYIGSNTQGRRYYCNHCWTARAAWRNWWWRLRCPSTARGNICARNAEMWLRRFVLRNNSRRSSGR